MCVKGNNVRAQIGGAGASNAGYSRSLCCLFVSLQRCCDHALALKEPFLSYTLCRSYTSLALTHQILKVMPKAITGPLWVEVLCIRGASSFFYSPSSVACKQSVSGFFSPLRLSTLFQALRLVLSDHHRHSFTPAHSTGGHSPKDLEAGHRFRSHCLCTLHNSWIRQISRVPSNRRLVSQSHI